MRVRRVRLSPAWVLPALALVAGISVAGLWFVRGSRPRLSDSHQNVLLVTIDTLRADALGCYGGKAATPTLDHLAANGLRFSFAHSHVPLTFPSHTSLMTGLYPLDHGIHDNGGFRLHADQRTLASILRAQGLSTGAFVSASTLDARLGLNSGFGVYDEGYTEGDAMGREVIAERRGADVVGSALKWLGQQSGQWFCWVHLFDPHAPYEPPSPYREQYAQQPYLGEVAYADAALKPLLEFAQASQRSTLVIVTSDHGESLGEHGELTHGLFAYESTIHVPLIVSQPKLLPSGQTIDSPVGLVDILPTVLELLGKPVPEGLRGRSLLEPRPADSTIYFEALSAMLTRGWAPLQGLLVGHRKYIELPLPELYDLSEDPNEAHNLIQANERPPAADDLQGSLRHLLEGWKAPAKDEVDPELAAQLESLGYTGGRAAVKDHYTVADDPKNLLHVDVALHQGIELRRKHEWSEAIRLYQQLLVDRPTLGLVYLQLANVYRQAGDLQNAVRTLESAVKKGVANPEAKSYLGIYWTEAGQAAKAIELLGTCAAALQRGDADALNALGMALASLGREPESAECFQGILQLDPDDPTALINTAVSRLRQGNLAGAEELLRHSVQVDATQPKAWNALGVIAARSGRREEAITDWKRAVELDPTQYDTLYNLGMLCFQLGDRAEARKHFEAFSKSAPPALYARDLDEVRRILATF